MTYQELKQLAERATRLSNASAGQLVLSADERNELGQLLADLQGCRPALCSDFDLDDEPLAQTVAELQALLAEASPVHYGRMRLALAQLSWTLNRIAEQWPVRASATPAQLSAFIAGVVGDQRAATLTAGLADRELRLLARVVNQLRFSLTADGVVMFLTRRRPDGTAPMMQRLSDPAQERALLSEATALRDAPFT